MANTRLKGAPRWLVKRGTGLLLLLLILVGGGAWGYDTYASGRALTDYPAPGRFVEVSGAKMHYVCQGAGEPTLVLEAGFAGGELDWAPILPALSQHHRVCAFDRLGQDWSDPAPRSDARSFGTAAEELHSALLALGVERPVVVGHSLGGALAQVYAAKYDVAGVVLVEGLTVDVVDPVVERLGSYRTLGLLARLGLLRPLGSLMVAPGYPAPIRDEMLALRSRSQSLLNVSDEGAVAQRSAGAELRAAEPLMRGPLLVIAAGQSDVPGLPAGAFVRAEQALSERKPHSTYVVVPGAGHYVQAERPAAVVGAIERWLTGLQ
jgi:pimeloyl-ACP methyl ester carboxylesterase